MPIKLIKERDVHLSQDDLERLRYEYDQSFTHCAGFVPSFEVCVRQKLKVKEQPIG